MATPARKHLRWPLAAGALVVAVLAIGAFAMARYDPVGPAPPGGFGALRAEAAYLTSDGCASCHRNRLASWQRTFHRTMTQTASEQAVRAPFDGRTLDWLGVLSIPRRTSEGGFEIETSHPATGEHQRFPVAMTVGSRRMQQYVTRMGDRHVRLPVAYSIAEQRWFHLSEAFFHADGEPFHANTTVWDLNCIFCHNVKARPGLDLSSRVAADLGPPAKIAASVAEQGIACEACHGPGGEHARRMRSPLRRVAFDWSGAADPTIVHPARLDPRRSTQVCGHCHGQRVPVVPEQIREILSTGDPFTPGEDLGRYFAPVTAETRVGDYSFAPRFWADGSPRLTAYEYQGLLRSRCFTEGEMSCLSCHAMHAGDPHGQLRPDRPGDAMCTQCHSAGYAGEPLAAHTHHAPESAGSRCTACHMPPVVYGIMSWHPTHEIVSPDPRRAAGFRMPDACTLCHAGRSRRWAAEQTETWWPGAQRGGGPRELPEEPEMARALFAGDVVYRTLAAHALGRPSPEREAARAAVPLLAQLLIDPFPNVRRTARLSLVGLLSRGDLPWALDPLDERRRMLDVLSAQPVLPPLGEGWPFLEDGGLDRGMLDGWAAERVEVPVAIGE